MFSNLFFVNGTPKLFALNTFYIYVDFNRLSLSKWLFLAYSFTLCELYNDYNFTYFNL